VPEVIYGQYPPNYNQIASTFQIRGKKGVVFTYGDKIYIPSGNKPAPDLMAHEEIHVQQQTKMGPDKWWERYLEDTRFRLDQELEAYRMQYAICKMHYGRTERRSVLKKISRDLAGPIYGNLMSSSEAEQMIKEGI
jgi:hypothetical protein